MHRPLALTLALSLCIALAGCGEDAPERADTIAADQPPATSAPAEKPAGNGETLSKRQAKAALLTVKDLPTGWAKDTQPDDDEKTTTKPTRCAEVFYALDNAADPVAKAEVRFAQGFQLIEHSVTSFDSDTEDLVKATGDAFSKCPTFTSIEPNGTRYEAKLAPLSFPNVGDRTLAVRMTATGGGTEFVADIVLIAVGHNAIGIFAGGLLPVPGADLEAIARKAVTKLG